jgi:tetratricopeptide (TPR) repeat protein
MTEQAAKDLVNKGVGLSEGGKPDQALSAYDEVIQKFGSSSDAAIRVQVARAYINKGIALEQMKKPLEALPLFDEALKLVGGQDEKQRETAAKAVLQKATVLRELNRHEDAMNLCADLVKQIAATVMPVPVAGALFTIADTMSTMGRQDEALPLYDDVVKRFGGSNDQALRPVVAGALFSKSMLLRFKGRTAEALATYDEIIKRFGEASEPHLRNVAAMAKQSKSELQAQTK